MIGRVEVLEIQIYKLKLLNIAFITGTKTYLVVNYSKLVWLQLQRSYRKGKKVIGISNEPSNIFASQHQPKVNRHEQNEFQRNRFLLFEMKYLQRSSSAP